MPFRFRKSIKFGKGFKLNLSKSGLSGSFGGRGASLNVGNKGVRGTVGIPGSGISFSQKLNSSEAGTNSNQVNEANLQTQIQLGVIVAIIFLIMMCGCGIVIWWALSLPPVS